ncbi:MAG: hypothetical protein OEX12_05360 [Gammaproteobacteria bacterium]|nr:hypothetical protein [Gammaproteobacteria bacterium]
MRNIFTKILFFLTLALLVETTLADQGEINIFNDPRWFPVNERTFSLLYEYDDFGYTNKSLLMQNGANDTNMFRGASLDYMEFNSGREQFALYGHVGYRPKWKLAPYIQGGVDIYSALYEILSGNGLKMNSRVTAGLQWSFTDSHIRFFYRMSNLDYTHFTSENGTYTTFGVSFGTITGRTKRKNRNPPVVAYNQI